MRTFKYRWSSALGTSLACHVVALGLITGFMLLFPASPVNKGPIEVDLVTMSGGGGGGGGGNGGETPQEESSPRSKKQKPHRQLRLPSRPNRIPKQKMMSTKSLRRHQRIPPLPQTPIQGTALQRGAPLPAPVVAVAVGTVQGMVPAMAVGKALAPVPVPVVGMALAMAAEMETAPVPEMASPWDRSF